MEIVAIIVGGLTLISLGGMVLDYLTKTQVSKTQANPDELQRLVQRVADLEAKAADQEARAARLEESVRFTTKLLEKHPE